MTIRKPYCQELDTEPIGVCGDLYDGSVTCSTDAECNDYNPFDNDGSTCLTDYTYFGNSPNACDKGYYEYGGAYNYDPENAPDNTCGFTIGGNSPNAMTDAERTELSSKLPEGTKYCAFRPRVIVIDNWGWCNGTCAGGNGGCWESEDQGANYQRCSSGQHPDYSTKVGTPFNGWVIVAEQK